MDIRILGFKIDYDRKGNERHWVHYAPSHSVQSSRTWARVADLDPANIKDDHGRRANIGDKKFHMEAVWSQIKPHYDAWLKNEEIPEGGTPLAAWAGVNDAQVSVLKTVGIRTVEQLSTVTDGAIEKIRLPNVRQLRETALEFVENKGEVATKEALEAANAKADEAVNMMAEMRAQMDAQAAKIAELEAGGKKPAPKAPPKKAPEKTSLLDDKKETEAA